jgi:serine/threonine protein phosphatase PrpC
MVISDYDYNASVVVSPMMEQDQAKNQDRAVWFPATRSACVCDGVTTSPHSEQAAEIVSQYSPALFSGDIKNNLSIICNLLDINRNEKLHSPIKMPADVSDNMKELLQQAAMENLKKNSQTTIVAAKITPENHGCNVEVVRCGDSIFLAFAPGGQLLTTSPANIETPGYGSNHSIVANKIMPNSGQANIFLGDEIIACLIDNCKNHPDIAKAAGINEKCAHNWLICAIIDKSSNYDGNNKITGHEVRYGDLLIVPKYLCSIMTISGSKKYIRFLYSRIIKPINKELDNTLNLSFRQKGSVTAVLPDSFYTGDWIYFKDRFPADAHYILASDGFYGAFESPSDIWDWLKENHGKLRDLQETERLMQDLHNKNKSRSGDDDISLVWIYPQKVTEGS